MRYKGRCKDPLLHFLRLFSHCEEEVKMTSCFLHGKWNFLTFGYAFPKEKWSNVILRAATFNISASLNSQLLPLVSSLTHTRQEGCLAPHALSSCQAGGKSAFPAHKKGLKNRVSCVHSLRPRFRLTSGQAEIPVTLWEDEYLLSWSFPV